MHKLNGYRHDDDQKIHTRYSDLKTCGTIEGARKIVDKYLNNKPGFKTGVTTFGQINHEIFEEESRVTGKVPKVFQQDITVQHIEEEFAIELIPGLVLHLRPDAISREENMLIDYKTMDVKEGMSDREINKLIKKKYKSAEQLRIYTYALMVNGITIDKYAYFLELWDKDNLKPVGYRTYVRDVDLTKIPIMKMWLIKRAFNLAVAYKDMTNGKVNILDA